MAARELVRIGDEVVQLPVAVCVLGVDVARRRIGAVLRRLEQVSRPTNRAVREQHQQRKPVDVTPCSNARRVGDRRREVGVDRRLRHPHAARHAGPADDERHADRRLVDLHLPGRDPVLAVEEAVVGGVDEERVVELTGRLQRTDDRGDALVDRQQRLQALAVVLRDPCDAARGAAGGGSAPPPGLSETSASLNDGDRGIGSLANRFL